MPSTATKANILMVDDRPENLVALEAVLGPLGENLVRANSGLEALRCLLVQDFALILMDAKMPGLSGFETAEIIRQREKSRHIPIIFVTAYGDEELHMFRGYSVGAVDYIPKPFDPDILRSKVRVFVELFKKNEQLKLQTELLHQSELREAARRQQELEEALEREQMRTLNEALEARVAERTAELVAANEELESFCYSVSHDLRTPLRAIVSTSTMLLETTDQRLTEDEREHLMRQTAAAQRLARLIDDLLQLSRLGREALRKTPIDITAAAKVAARDVQAREWPGQHEIMIGEGLEADADRNLTELLLRNLIENAIKYSPNGGCIQIGQGKQGQQRYFFVRDEGIGFDMKYAKKLFKPFERLVTDREYEGTGIGLAIVHRIVTRHGGKVWAQSQPGQGATFFFTLD